MQIKTVLRIIGQLLMVFSVSMLVPILVNFYYKDSHTAPYLIAFVVTIATGFVLWFAFRHHARELKVRDGFLIVVLFWFVLSGFAALPLMIAPQPHDTFTDALFESVSGFTTTGATVVTNVDQLPHAMRYYRQQLQFLGGMGIVVLAVAILPMLGVGGMQLFRAETPGPMKDNKLTPRITETAKALWVIYLGLTVLCAAAYALAGMTVFDAIGESFATISTGGFSMHDSSFAYYKSPLLEGIASVFMFLGAVNFSLHFLAIRGRHLRAYWQDEEFRAYLWVLALLIGLSVLVLWWHQIYTNPVVLWSKSLFTAISMSSTTGFIAAPFASWPTFLPVFIMVGALIGGCAASTSGGIKVIRLLLLHKQTSREVRRLVHPNAVMTLKFGNQLLPEPVLQAMWSYIAAFISLFVVLLLGLMACGLDLTSAFGALSASIANAGAGIGSVAVNFKALNVPSKWICIVAMLAGRLEIFTLLVVLTPTFWRK